MWWASLSLLLKNNWGTTDSPNQDFWEPTHDHRIRGLSQRCCITDESTLLIEVMMKSSSYGMGFHIRNIICLPPDAHSNWHWNAVPLIITLSNELLIAISATDLGHSFSKSSKLNDSLPNARICSTFRRLPVCNLAIAKMFILSKCRTFNKNEITINVTRMPLSEYCRQFQTCTIHPHPSIVMLRILNQGALLSHSS